MTQETINQVLKFRDDRNWKQFHNPKDLAISIRSTKRSASAAASAPGSAPQRPLPARRRSLTSSIPMCVSAAVSVSTAVSSVPSMLTKEGFGYGNDQVDHQWPGSHRQEG